MTSNIASISAEMLRGSDPMPDSLKGTYVPTGFAGVSNDSPKARSRS
jgi:hypothetical protein